MEEFARGLHLAQHYLDVDQPARALEICQRLSGPDLESEEHWVIRSCALKDLDRFEEAIRTAQAGLAHHPESLQLLYVIGFCNGQLNRLAEAEKAFLMALRLEPDNPTLLAGYAQIAALGGQFEKAHRLLERAAEQEADNIQVLQVRSFLAMLDGHEKGVNDLLKEDPESTMGHAMRGIVLSEKGRTGEAERHLRQTVMSHPEVNEFAEMTRELRLANHWLLWPLRPVYRLGPAKVWIIAVLTVFALHHFISPKAAGIFGMAYLGFCVYSWTLPPLLRWWMKRR